MEYVLVNLNSNTTIFTKRISTSIRSESRLMFNFIHFPLIKVQKYQRDTRITQENVMDEIASFESMLVDIFTNNIKNISIVNIAEWHG